MKNPWLLLTDAERRSYLGGVQCVNIGTNSLYIGMISGQCLLMLYAPYEPLDSKNVSVLGTNNH